jgi:hypothetical protein
MKKLILIFSLLHSSINVSAAEINNPGVNIITSYSQKSVKLGTQPLLLTHKDYITVMNQKDRLIKLNKVKEDQLAQYCNAARTDIVTGGIVHTLGVPSININTINTINITNNMPIPTSIFEKKITGTEIKKGVETISSVIDDGIKQGAYTNQQKVSCLATFNNFITEWNVVNKVARIDMLNTMNTNIGKILIKNDHALSNNNFISFNQNINSCNSLSTFFTNQNAVQSTCLGGGSCAAPVGGM